MPSCVLMVQNLPVPLDRRVWQQARALTADGWAVSVICPKSAVYAASYEELEGVRVHRFPLPFEAASAPGFLLEYGLSLLFMAWLLLRVALTTGFDLVQVCNPPDLLFLIALPYRLFGKRLVFDYHDNCPDLFALKFGRGPVQRLATAVERASFRGADAVVTVNESYRRIAIERGGRAPADVVAVHSAPDLARFRRAPRAPDADDTPVLGYLGVIGSQDGVTGLVRAVAALAASGERFRAVVVGGGPGLAEAQALAAELGVGERLRFAGMLHGPALMAELSTFDVGAIPDPPNAYNHAISMNKVFEYSALGVPSVSFALNETRRLLGEAGTYAAGDTPEALADACRPLLRDPALRAAHGAAAQARMAERFSWEHEAARYVGFYRALLAAPQGRPQEQSRHA